MAGSIVYETLPLVDFVSTAIQRLHTFPGKIGGPCGFSAAPWELWGGDSWVTLPNDV